MKIFNILSLLIFAISCNKTPTEPNGKQPTEPDTTTHNIIWQIDTIGIFGSDLIDVWGSSPSNVYVVGTINLDSTATQIAHWNGSKWQPLPLIPDFFSAMGIIGFSPNDIWIAGVSGRGPGVAHFNGTKWIVQNIFASFYNSKLTAIWGTSSNDLWAVGYYGLIVHYNGTSWTQINSGTTMGLIDVWGNSKTNIYFAGGSDDGGTGILFHFNGYQLKKIFERNIIPSKPSGLVNAVWTLNDTTTYIYTAGTANCYMGRDTIWTYINVLNDNTRINSIKGSSNKNILFSGYFGLITHWNGKSWYRYDQFFNKPNGDDFFGMWVDKNDIFIVGSSAKGARGIVYRGKLLQ